MKGYTMKLISLKTTLIFVLFAVTTVFAQPQQKFRLVTPIASGGSFGPFLTALTADVSKDNNIEMTVDHAPGGGGVVAFNKFNTSNLSSTVLLGSQALWSIAPQMPKDETTVSIENLVPLVLIGSNKFCLLASEESKIKTFNDLIQQGKNQRLLYNSFGNPANMEPLMFEYMKHSYGLNLEPLNYKTMSDHLIAITRNDLQLALVTSKICTGGNLPKNSTVVGYTTNSLQPSLATKFQFQSIVFLMAHKNMPKETQDYLAKVISAALIKNRDRYEPMVGQPDTPAIGQELTRILETENNRWRRIINKIHD